MTILYMDPVGGNDASDGLSFAARKRSFKSASQAAASGDTVRVIASKDPANAGPATWSDFSRNISWSNGANKKIDGCDSGWTGVTNTTVTHHGDNMGKVGTSYLSCYIAAAFTTGKIAYKTLPAALTLSSFQQVAFHFKASYVSGTTIDLKIALCSDTTGDTIVAELNRTITVTSDGIQDNTWIPLVLDYGSAFPSTPINSIAIYVNTVPSTSWNTFFFDSFTCCKAPGAADLIDLFSLVGKNTTGEPEWYPIVDCDENGVVIAGHRLDTKNTVRSYRGPSETVNTYVLNPLVLAGPWGYTNEAQLQVNGITFEGGYNRTDMSTKTGMTWISGASRWSGLNCADESKSDTSVKNIGFAHCINGVLNIGIGQGAGVAEAVFDLLGLIACETPVTFVATGTSSSRPYRYSGSFKFSCKQVWASKAAMPTPSRPGVYAVGRIHGNNYNDAASSAAWQPAVSFDTSPMVLRIGKIDNNKYAIDFTYACDEVKLVGTVIENNDNVMRAPFATPHPIRLHFDNMADQFFAGDTNMLYDWSLLQKWPSWVKQTRIGGDPTKTRTVAHGLFCFEASQTVRHTASGYAWRFYLPDWYGFYNERPESAYHFPLTYVAAEAGKLVTVTCWVYNEFDVYQSWDSPVGYPTASFGIAVLPDDTMGLALQQVPADMTIHGAWQQVTLSFTPAVDGVVPIYAYGLGTGDSNSPPTLYSAYFDDVEVTQAV